MADPSHSPRPVVLPSVGELLSRPALAAALPAEAAASVLAQVGKELAEREALRETLRVRLAALAAHPGENGKPDLLDAQGVADMLGRSKSWVDHHLADLPPRCSLLGAPVWRREDVERFVASLPTYGA